MARCGLRLDATFLAVRAAFFLGDFLGDFLAMLSLCAPHPRQAPMSSWVAAIHYGGALLLAGPVIDDRNVNEVMAEGNVFLRTAEGSTTRSDRLRRGRTR